MRKPRIEYPGALFHVIARGNQKQAVFLDDGDRVRYLKRLGEHLEGREIRLYAYCLMPNHVHLLLRQGGAYPLSRFMQRLQSAYTTFFNRKHGRVGHLFQGRYKAILVDADSYLLELIRYIHLNPLRAGLKDAVRYPWSSHRQYIGKDRHPLAPVDAKSVLKMFASIKPLAVRKYRAFIDDPDRERNWGSIYDVRGGRFMGDEEFEAETLRAGRQGGVPSFKLKGNLEGFWKAVLKREGITSGPSGHRRSRLIAETAFIAIEGVGVSQRKVAEHFGMEPTALNMAIRRMRARWDRGEGSKDDLVRWAKKVNCEA